MPPVRLVIDYTSAVNQRAGIGRYTRELVRTLLTLPESGRYDVNLIIPRRPAQAPPTPPAGARWCKLPLTEWQAVLLWQRAGVPLPLNVFCGRAGVFHAPDFLLPPVRAGRRIVTVHDLSYLVHPDLAHPAVYRYLEKTVPRSVARADRVIAVSESTKRDVVRLLGVPEDRVDVIPEGVDRVFRPEAEPDDTARRARLRLPERYLLSVGTIQPRKNYGRLLEACERLWQVEPAAPHLVIAGQRGWLFEEFFAQLEASRFRDRVRILDFVDDADLPALYRGTETFVYPSCYEGFGLPVVEALACGRPVICSSASSLPEVAGAAARLIDPFSVEDLAEALLDFSRDSATRATFATSGPQQAARFTWEAAARDHLAVYAGETVGRHDSATGPAGGAEGGRRSPEAAG